MFTPGGQWPEHLGFPATRGLATYALDLSFQMKFLARLMPPHLPVHQSQMPQPCLLGSCLPRPTGSAWSSSMQRAMSAYLSVCRQGPGQSHSHFMKPLLCVSGTVWQREAKALSSQRLLHLTGSGGVFTDETLSQDGGSLKLLDSCVSPAETAVRLSY